MAPQKYIIDEQKRSFLFILLLSGEAGRVRNGSNFFLSNQHLLENELSEIREKVKI